MNTPKDDKAAKLSARFEGKIADIINGSDDPKIAAGPTRAAIQMYDDALEWDRRGGGYDGWLEMIKNYFYNENLMALDTTGELRAIADEYFAQDLRDYYIQYVGLEPRDVEMIAIKRRMLDDFLDQLLDK